MFWLVEDDIQLEKFLNYCKEDAFIEIIPYSNVEHPTQNNICAIYIRPLNSTKGYMIPISHSETLNVDLNAVKCAINNINNVFVRDKKEFLHYLIIQNLFDTTLNMPTYIPEYTKTHSYFYNKYSDKKDINRIIPIVKHYEYCENLYNNLKDKINEVIVTEDHPILYRGKWIKARQHPFAKKTVTNKFKYMYCLMENVYRCNWLC
mgnify:CR=1 FL=1